MSKQAETSPPTVDEIRIQAEKVAFGNRKIENSFRGLVAEIIVGAAIGPEWELCSGDWGGWDFEYVSDRAYRLEVKQSAAQQTWEQPEKLRPPRFGIPEKKARWEGAKKIAEAGRFAQIYVFAYHPVRDDSIDHRNASQWEFHVVAAKRLPAKKSIGLVKVRLLSKAVPWTGLRNGVEEVRATL